MDEPVNHKATIVSIDGHDVTLHIIDSGTESCGGCRLADLCSKADNGGTIRISVDSVNGLREGMTVEASVDERSQGLAIVWTLVMPLVIFLAVLMPLTSTAMARWAVILIAIGAVGLYDLLLWRFGPKLSRSIRWTLTPIV